MMQDKFIALRKTTNCKTK